MRVEFILRAISGTGVRPRQFAQSFRSRFLPPVLLINASKGASVGALAQKSPDTEEHHVQVAVQRGWGVRRKVSGFVDLMGGAEWTPVTLPHDAMIDLPRVSSGGSGPSGAYFPGGEVEYRKTLDVPASWRERRVSVEFEGVYRDAMIYANNEFAGQWRYGYSVFRISLDAHLRCGQTNVIRVEARAHQDSWWYTGLGIYRDVHLVVAPLAHIVDGGMTAVV